MNCKHCNAELAENAKFCSNCGQPVVEPEQVTAPVEEIPAQQTMNGPEILEEKKPGTGKVALIVAGIVLVLAALIAIVINGLGAEELITGDDTTIAPTSGMLEETVPATEATIPADTGADDTTCKGTYTVTDEELVAAADTVVATMGDATLTVGQLQVYYWTEVIYFIQDYGSYASYFGLDFTQPLDMQTCTLTDTPMTWQQYFLACALDSWTSYQSMTLEAEAAGLTISDEILADMESLPTDLDEAAAGYGMSGHEELLQTNFGACVTLEDYLHFWTLYYSGYEYYNAKYEGLQPSAEEVEAYFAENEATYTEEGITKESGKYVDVRHILFTVAEGATEEDWEACRQEAQAVLDAWLEGEATEDSFAALANEKSEDPGSNTTGGLYENVYVGQMVPEFNDWCFDEIRVVGDYGLVKTDYGYHVMFFSGSRDIWFATAENDLWNELISSLVPEAIEAHPYEIDYQAIVLGLTALY